MVDILSNTLQATVSYARAVQAEEQQCERRALGEMTPAVDGRRLLDGLRRGLAPPAGQLNRAPSPRREKKPSYLLLDTNEYNRAELVSQRRATPSPPPSCIVALHVIPRQRPAVGNRRGHAVEEREESSELKVAQNRRDRTERGMLREDRQMV
jgi:hypothetical protein